MGAQRNFGDWVVATRPWSFPAALVAMLMPLSYYFWAGSKAPWYVFILVIVMGIAFQAAGNLLGDYHDHVSGVDSQNNYNGVMSMKSGKFSPSEIQGLGWAMLVIGLVLGLTVALLYHDWYLLLFGLVGACLTAVYYWLKYHALGDLDILLLFGLLPAIGIGWMLCGKLDWRVLLLALPHGLQIVAILHANNTRDIVTDRAAGIRTLSMNIGGRTAQWLFAVETLLPYLLIAAYALLGWMPYWSLLTWLCLPISIRSCKQMLQAPVESDEAIAQLDQAQGKLVLLFGLLLSIGFFLGTWIA
ncbi:MAG: prenyltransferase [Paludibacteraceae bacterium]|nr:prenyltransferase [Paludibacteraceae bacterium]